MRLALPLSLLVFGTAFVGGAEEAARTAWSAKIDPRVFASAALDAAGEADFIVVLDEQADVSGAEKLATKLEKGTYVFARLTEVARRVQPAVLRALAEQGSTAEPFWVANMIRVRGKITAAVQMAERADVARIDPNPLVSFSRPAPAKASAPEALTGIEPGVSLVNAPAMWSRGYTGQGIVIGATDTGYRWTHAAIKRQYRGWNGTSADHNFNWHDAIHSGGGVCGPNATQPCDDDGHGTHTMGTMLGADGGTNQVGVAPGARWMGCRCMDQGNGTPATYAECLQWFIAPTDSSGNNPTPGLAPDVINNSWGCPASEGCAPTTLQTAIENVRAAGIVVVVAAGNSGSACSTVEDAPAIYDASICVGATTASNAIASFSSRGPVTADGSNRLKPNVSAPGVSVRSATRASDTAYTTLSGTSMAAPHTVGTVALILSAHPGLRGNVRAIQTLLEQSALRLAGTQTCGGTPGTAIPNTTFGWGRIDALAGAGLDDPDGDGMVDWQELIAGTDRANAGSRLRVSAIDRTGNDLAISFSTVLLKRYRLERADDLAAPAWSTVADNITGTGGSLQQTDANAALDPRHFYRLVVVP